MPDRQYPVFVYGTLRRGGRLHSNLCRWATQIRPAFAPGFVLYGSGVPSLGVGGFADTAVGELVDIDPRVYEPMLARLDNVEHYHPYTGVIMYIRALIPVQMPGAREWDQHFPAWAYLGGPGYRTDERIPGDDYANLVQLGDSPGCTCGTPVLSVA